MSNNEFGKFGEHVVKLTSKSLIYEVELIARLLYDPSKTVTVATLLSEKDFYRYGKEFSLIVSCYANGKNISDELKDIGVSYLTQVEWQANLSFRPIEVICEDLLGVAKSMRLYFILGEGAEEVTDDNAEEIAASVQQKMISAISTKEKEKKIGSLLNEFTTLQNFYIDRFKNGNKLIGLSSGIEKIDELIDGIRPPHIWVMAGFTSMGKSFAALNIAVSLIRQKKRVVFYSLEMSRIDIIARTLGIMTGLNGMSILKGYSHDKRPVDQAMQQIKESDFQVFTEKFELTDIQFSMYEQTTIKPVDLFIVDYLQLVTMKGARSEYESTTAVALGLQKTAKKLNCAIMELSQINNDSAKNESEVMGFKGSGAIAAAADIAIEIVRGDLDKDLWKKMMYAGEPVPMKWWVRKNRHGRSASIPMTFNGRTGVSCYQEEAKKFDEIAGSQQNQLPLKRKEDIPF